MRFIEGQVWSVWLRYTNGQAARVLKRVYVVADTAEKAQSMAKEAMALNGAVEYTSMNESYDGLVVE